MPESLPDSSTKSLNADAASEPAPRSRSSWPAHAVWAGLVITLAGLLSYFLYFYQFPVLRDFPLLNLPAVLLGVALAAAGCWRILRRGSRWFSGALAGAALLLSLAIAGLFCFYVFHLSYQLPEAAAAPSAQAQAPDFTLPDQNGEPVSLSDYRGQKIVLVFYRGDW